MVYIFQSAHYLQLVEGCTKEDVSSGRMNKWRLMDANIWRSETYTWTREVRETVF